MLALLAVPLALQLSAPPTARPPAGTATLPLRDYLTLVEKIESLDAARAAARAKAEPSVAELVSQQLTLVLGDDDADLTASYEVELRGVPSAPVPLPLAGLASRVAVEPAGAAAVHRTKDGLALVAPAAGRYRVNVWGKAAVTSAGAADAVSLAPMTAPVGELAVTMASGRTWRCAGAIVAEDKLVDGKRQLRLALPRGQGASFETRRELRAGETAQAVASAVLVTLVQLAREGARRHDVVLYEVARGELSALEVTLPAGLEVERVVSDEGEVVPWVDGRTLRVERTKKLAAATSGYLALSSSAVSAAGIPLAAVTPQHKVRARYAAVAADVAASFAPAPETGWSRVDLTDLPAAVGEAAQALGLVAAWRAKGEEAGHLDVNPLPAPPMLDGLVHARDTLTLLTVEGTLLHRDRFTVATEKPTVELPLPAGATLWSAQVNGVPVRPVERAGRAALPLGVAPGAEARVEVVVVEEKAIPAGRSELRLAPPELSLPVLVHEWRLLLPSRNSYRLVESDLRRSSGRTVELLPVEGQGVVGGVVGGVPRGHAKAAGNTARGPGGDSGILGTVTDASGSTIPGATVRLSDTSRGVSLEVTTDATGRYAFLALPPGSYRLRAELPGFKPYDARGLRLGLREAREAPVRLEVGAVSESITVQAQTAMRLLPGVAALDAARQQERQAETSRHEAEQKAEYDEQAGLLKQGLVGGVKPLPIVIPEAGKVLTLAGSLPPARVGVVLQVKAPRK